MTFAGSVVDLTLSEPYGLPLSPWVSPTPFLLLLVPSILCSFLLSPIFPDCVPEVQEHTQDSNTHHLCPEVHLCLAGSQGGRRRIAQEHGLLGKARGCG